MGIEEFKHLWDGSEPDWTLLKFSQDIWHLSFHFTAGGPDARQITTLRQLVPELMHVSLPEAHKQLKGCSCYRPQEGYGNIPAQELQHKASALGFQVSREVTHEVSFLPIRNSIATVIEDDELARSIFSKMIEAGVPVIESHAD